jgi:peptide/nickel transport system permease protein
MARVAGRLLAAVPVLFGGSILVFLMMKLIPGDIAVMLAGPQATAEDLRLIREALALDRPVYVQYLAWIGRVLQGDLGYSLEQQTPVAQLIWTKFGNTLLLTLAGMAFAVALGIPAGIISAVRQYSVFDRAAMALSLFGSSMPSFWLGLILIIVFSMELGWFPSTGMYSMRDGGGLLDVLWHLVLPAITLGAGASGIIARMMRSSMLEVIRQDYVLTARAKGLTDRRVILKHAVKNALIPVLTIVGVQVGYLLGGAILTEAVFSWPGLGFQMYKAIASRDVALVLGGVLFLATVFVFINLVVDLLYTRVDPRIRL